MGGLVRGSGVAAAARRLQKQGGARVAAAVCNSRVLTLPLGGKQSRAAAVRRHPGRMHGPRLAIQAAWPTMRHRQPFVGLSERDRSAQTPSAALQPAQRLPQRQPSARLLSPWRLRHREFGWRRSSRATAGAWPRSLRNWQLARCLRRRSARGQGSPPRPCLMPTAAPPACWRWAEGQGLPGEGWTQLGAARTGACSGPGPCDAAVYRCQTSLRPTRAPQRFPNTRRRRRCPAAAAAATPSAACWLVWWVLSLLLQTSPALHPPPIEHPADPPALPDGPRPRQRSAARADGAGAAAAGPYVSGRLRKRSLLLWRLLPLGREAPRRRLHITSATLTTPPPEFHHTTPLHPSSTRPCQAPPLPQDHGRGAAGPALPVPDRHQVHAVHQRCAGAPALLPPVAAARGLCLRHVAARPRTTPPPRHARPRAALPAPAARPPAGTGHAGMEMCIANLLEPGETILVGVNGIWVRRGAGAWRRRPPQRTCACCTVGAAAAGMRLAPAAARSQPPHAPTAACRPAALQGERVCDMAGRFGANVVPVRVEPGRSISLQQLTEAVQQHKPAVVFLVQVRCCPAFCQGVGAFRRSAGRRPQLSATLHPPHRALGSPGPLPRRPRLPSPPPAGRASPPRACTRAWRAWATCAAPTARCWWSTPWPRWAACPCTPTPGRCAGLAGGWAAAGGLQRGCRGGRGRLREGCRAAGLVSCCAGVAERPDQPGRPRACRLTPPCPALPCPPPRQVDAIYSGSQKCLAAPPGAAPLMMNDRALAKARLAALFAAAGRRWRLLLGEGAAAARARGMRGGRAAGRADVSHHRRPPPLHAPQIQGRKTKVQSYYFDLHLVGDYW